MKGWTTSRWERDESFTWASDEGKETMVGLKDQPYTWHWPIEAVGDTWRLPSSKPLRRVNLRVREKREKGLFTSNEQCILRKPCDRINELKNLHLPGRSTTAANRSEGGEQRITTKQTNE